MLLLSAQAGALSARIGPRVPMTLGTAVCAVSLLMMLGIGPGASYWSAVFPSVLVLGLGLSLLVAPLTSTAMSSVSDAQAGVASGVNNAVARAAGLLAIAVLPVLAGLSGDSYTDPRAFAEGFRVALLVSAGVLIAAAVLAAVTIRNPKPMPEPLPVPDGPEPLDPAAAALRHCSVDGPTTAQCAAVQASQHAHDR
jgi:MFS family permease